MKLLRNIFYILFILINYYLNSFIKSIIDQKNCPCNTGWKVENLKVLSQLGIFIGIINFFIPLNKSLYKIPLVSTIFSILLLIIICAEIFILTRFSRNLIKLKKCKGCNIDGFEYIINYCKNLSLFYTIFISISVTICLLYM